MFPYLGMSFDIDTPKVWKVSEAVLDLLPVSCLDSGKKPYAMMTCMGEEEER